MSVKPSQLEIRTCCLECWSPGLSCFFVFKESISWLLVVNAAMIFDLEGWRGSMLYNCTCGFEKKHQGKVQCCFLLCFHIAVSSRSQCNAFSSGWGVTMLRNAATSPGTEMFAYTLHCTVVVGSHRMGQTWGTGWGRHGCFGFEDGMLWLKRNAQHLEVQLCWSLLH